MTVSPLSLSVCLVALLLATRLNHGNALLMVIVPENVTVYYGDTITAACAAFGSPSPTITWRRNGVLLPSAMQTSTSTPYSQLNGNYITRSVLKVCGTTPQEGGEYSCTATNGMATVTHSWHVTHHPQPQIVVTQQDIEVEYATTAIMSCVANGDPLPSISWYKNGDMVSSMTSPLLTINTTVISRDGFQFVRSVLGVCSITPDDEGVYSCTATSVAGSDTQSWNVTLDVSPPQIVITNENVTVDLYSYAAMGCVANGKPLPVITWQRNDQELSDGSDGVNITNAIINGSEFNFIQSILEVCNIGALDVGEYSCTATNPIANQTRSWNVNIPGLAPAQVVIAHDSHDVDYGSTVFLVCVAHGYPHPLVTWRRNGVILTNSTLSADVSIYTSFRNNTFVETYLELCDFGLGDDGEFMCTATNELGIDSPSWNVTAVGGVAAQVVIAHHSDNVDYGSTVMMVCVVRGNPLPELTWRRNGAILTNNTADVSIRTSLRNDSGMIFMQSYLELCDFGLGDDGEFSCAVSNELGNDSQSWNATAVGGISAQVVIAPQTYDVDYGNNVTMECVIHGNPLPELIWRRNGAILTNNTADVSVYLNFQNDTFVQSYLELYDFGLGDDGEFSCTATNELGIDSPSWNVTVVGGVAAQVVIAHHSDNVDYGSTVVMACVIHGNPLPELTWRRNGVILTNNTADVSIYTMLRNDSGMIFVQSYLELCDFGLGDDGEFSCAVSNELGNDSQSWNVTAVGGISAQVVIAPQTYDVDYGNNVTMECVIHGNPLPELIWRRNGVILTNNTADVSIYTNFQNNTFVQSYLELYDFGLGDDGEFSCTVSNELGIDSPSWNVTAVGGVAAQVVIAPQTYNVDYGNNVTMECVIHGNPLPELIWRRNGVILTNNTADVSIYTNFQNDTFVQSYLELYDFGLGDDGEFSCTVSNELGIDSPSWNVTAVGGVAAQVVIAPQTYNVDYGNNVTMECVIHGNPLPELIWRRNGVILTNNTADVSIYTNFQNDTFVQSYLELYDFGLGDDGEFSCTVSNELGIDSPSWNVTAVGGVAAQVVIAPQTYNIDYGNNVTMECVIHGNPLPERIWRRNGVILTNNTADVSIYTNFINESFEQSYVKIHDFGLGDDGEFSCTVSNELGSDSQSWNVTAVGGVAAQVVIAGQDYTVELGSTVLMGCVAYGNPLPQITWTRNGQAADFVTTTTNVMGGNSPARFVQSILEICDLKLNETGRFTCTTTNELGTQSHSWQLVGINPVITCPADVVREGDLMYPETLAGVLYVQECPVPANVTYTVAGNSSRRCLLDGSWGDVDTTNCTRQDFQTIAKEAERVFSQNVTDIEPKAVESIIEELSNITEPDTTGGVSQFPKDLNTTVNIVNQTVDFLNANLESDNPLDFNERVINVINNVLDESNQDGWEALQMSDAGSEQLLLGAEVYGQYVVNALKSDNVNTGNDTERTLERDNVVLEATLIDETNITDIYFPVEVDRDKQFAQSRVPADLLIERGAEDGNVSAINILFTNLEEFLPRDGLDQTTRPVTPVISTQVISESGTSDELETFAEFRFQTQPFPRNEVIATNPRCAFWDFSTENLEDSRWATDRVNTTIVSEDKERQVFILLCRSNHLTSFAVLMDVNQVLETISEEERTALNVVSYVGLSLSIVFLSLTTIFLLTLKGQLFKQMLYFIHLNLSVALLLANITFVAGIDTAVPNRYMCVLVAALLHYLYTTVFFWMLCEGIMLFLKVVLTLTTVGDYITKRWWIFFIIGWGIPIIPVAISVGVIHQQYGTDKYCWISVDDTSKGALWAFVVPFIIVVLLNIAIFVTTLTRVFISRRSKLEHDEKRHKRLFRLLVYNGLSLLPLLGLTWVFGLLSINQNTTVFIWLFTIFNSLQGFFIFFFQVIRNEKVWKWITSKLKGKEKKDRRASTFSSSTGWNKTDTDSTVISGKGSSDYQSSVSSEHHSTSYHTGTLTRTLPRDSSRPRVESRAAAFFKPVPKTTTSNGNSSEPLGYVNPVAILEEEEDRYASTMPRSIGIKKTATNTTVTSGKGKTATLPRRSLGPRTESTSRAAAFFKKPVSRKTSTTSTDTSVVSGNNSLDYHMGFASKHRGNTDLTGTLTHDSVGPRTGSDPAVSSKKRPSKRSKTSSKKSTQKNVSYMNPIAAREDVFSEDPNDGLLEIDQIDMFELSKELKEKNAFMMDKSKTSKKKYNF